MATRKELMNSLVKEEAKKLKKRATLKEIGRLKIEDLDPNNFKRCIYGQMAKSCFSDRANELIVSCAKRVYRTKFHDLKESPVNGAPKLSPGQDRASLFLSPIEVFIMQPINKQNGNNERIIKYLKGETKTLRLV